MSKKLNSYILNTARADKESFPFIANALKDKIHSTAIKFLGTSHFDDADDMVQIF